MLLSEAKKIAGEILNEGFYAVHSSPNLFKQLNPKGQERHFNSGGNTYGNGIYFIPNINPYSANPTGFGEYTYICYIKGSLKDDFIEAGTTTLKDIFGREIKNLRELDQLDLFTPNIEKILNGYYKVYQGKYGKRNSSIYKDHFKNEEKMISANMKSFDAAVNAFYNNGTLIENHRFLYMFSEMIKNLFIISPSKLTTSINGAIESVFHDLTHGNREEIINSYDNKINPETMRIIDNRLDVIGKKYIEKANNELNKRYSNLLKALDEIYNYQFLSGSERIEKYDNTPQTFFDNLTIKGRVHNMDELIELIKRIAMYHQKIRQSARVEAVLAMISLLPVTMIYLNSLYHNKYIRRLKKGIYVPRRIDMWKGWKELIVWGPKDIKVVKRIGPKASFDNLKTHRLDKEDSERFKPNETGWSGTYNFS